MYNPKQILKGFRNPQLAKEEVNEVMIRKLLFPWDSCLNYARHMDNSSRVGLVLNWGFHKRDYWTVAQSPFLIEAIIEEYNPVIISSQRGYEKHKSHLDYLISCEPGWSAPKITYDTCENHVIGVLVSDPHNKTEWFGSYVETNNINYVFTRYYHPFKVHFPDLNRERLIHLPWAVPEDCMIDVDEISVRNQDYIHLFGATGNEIYEVRDWCRGFPFVKSHANSGAQNKVMDHQEYYQWCQNFDAMIAAGTTIDRLKYSFAKYFEIPAAGSLLFAQECPDLDRLGFTEDNCVIFTKETFESRAQEYINSPGEFLKTRQRCCKLMHDRHTVADRVEKIRSTLYGDNDQ